MEATPWRDRAKASSTGNAFDISRSESLRMDETAPAASSALRSKESPSLSIFDSGSFLFNSSALLESDLTLFFGGFQTVRGMTANGCSTTPPKRLFPFAVDLEWGCELETVGASARGDCARSDFQIGADREDEDAPNFGTLAKTGRSFSAEPGVFCFTL